MSTTQLAQVLIDGRFRSATNPLGSFHAFDPTTRRELEPEFPISGREDVAAALKAAVRAVDELEQLSPEARAHFLELYAAELEKNAEQLVAAAARETALPAATRLRQVELPRTVNQLRTAAAAVRKRDWCLATIDTRSGLRARFGALGGAVLVLGPNNFPFAFNAVSGGDFAAAIAAGNPVIAKAHPSHPETTRLLADRALAALTDSRLPRATLQLLYHVPEELGLELVTRAEVGATAFTGSKRAGLKLKAAADRAGKPIYLEMSSSNPVFFLPGALRERGQKLADELYESCTLGAGQFCTRPGLSVIVDGPEAKAFLDALESRFSSGTAGTLLSRSVESGLEANVAELTAAGARLVTGGKPVPDAGYCFANTLLRVNAREFLERAEALQADCFGGVHLVVSARDFAELLAVARALLGNLTGSIYSDTVGSDDAAYLELASIVRRRVGRLLNDKMPTGVAVSSAMNHGGPFPATGHPGFTAVGMPASLLRFAALHSYDNVRPARLPPELADKNPTGKMWRYVDGEWTQRDLGVA
ncbi:MAG TPA: aldehyde dehydrogenase family protein [Polyangiaceae bacterium]|nr:aldehyde dehydrogenase family protein [Polyangiaceae bacterium]